MPLTFKIDHDKRLVTVQTSGLVTLADAVKVFRSKTRAIMRPVGEREA